MKLYERIENNNFDEIDKNRAIELIEGGNGHLVYNEDYFKLQKENEELKLYNNSITSQLEQMTTEKFKEGWIHQSEFKDFIPVQKVKDKIEELDKEKLKYDNDLRIYTLRNTFDFQKEVLQELLGKE